MNLNIHDTAAFHNYATGLPPAQKDHQLSIQPGNDGVHAIAVVENHTPESRAAAVTHFENSITTTHGPSMRNFAFPSSYTTDNGGTQHADQMGLTTKIINITTKRIVDIQDSMTQIRSATNRINNLTNDTLITAHDLNILNAPPGPQGHNIYNFLGSAHHVTTITSQVALTTHDEQMLRNLRILDTHVSNIVEKGERRTNIPTGEMGQHENMVQTGIGVSNLYDQAHGIIHPNDSTSSGSDT